MAAIPKGTGPGAGVPVPPGPVELAASIRAISILSRAMASLLLALAGGAFVMVVVSLMLTASALRASSLNILCFGGPPGMNEARTVTPVTVPRPDAGWSGPKPNVRVLFYIGTRQESRGQSGGVRVGVNLMPTHSQKRTFKPNASFNYL